MTSDTIREIIDVLTGWPGPIIVAYSGGKDSSAVVKLVIAALIERPQVAGRVSIIYCDTKVENPILDRFVKGTLRRLRRELAALGLDVAIRILTPALHQRYFVRVIGRGYPPPTSFFRWCTKDLRIRPVQAFVRGSGADSLVMLGTRRGESMQRDRVIARGGDVGHGPVIQKQIDGGLQTSLYMPIIRYALDDVWECLAGIDVPRAIDVHQLAQLYREGGGECPTIRETNDQPCASARFGCWVCTVVRRDRSAENLLRAGHRDLQAYYDFRAWLSSIRNDADRRCHTRRNGSIAMGPFTLATRRLLLRRVRRLEKAVGQTLITRAEEGAIRALWEADARSPAYMATERSATVRCPPRGRRQAGPSVSHP